MNIEYRPTLPASLLVLVAACAMPPAATVEEATFAPQLAVELDAMERTESGLHYRDLAEGDGDEARAGRHVEVYFVGWLPDGTMFDGLAAPEDPVGFDLGAGEVIEGWDEGIEGMRVGGQRMLVVPASLAYGHTRVGNVPPNSVLVFVVELVGVR